MNRNGIYLYGYYGQGNLGDDLLMASAVRMIRAIRPEASIFVHCHDPARLPDLGDRHIVPVAASAELAQTGVSKVIRLARYFRLLRATFRSCDTLVFGGGTVLQDSQSSRSVMLIALMVVLARLCFLKVLLIGAGVGSFRTRMGRWSARLALALCHAAAFRDPLSLSYALELAPGGLFEQSADLVFSSGEHAAQARSGRVVAISIQPSVAGRLDEVGLHARTVLRSLVQHLVADGRSVRLLIFETKTAGHDGIDDEAAWIAILGDLIKATPDQLQLAGMRRSDGNLYNQPARLLDGCAIHVGMRFHGHVLSAIRQLPFVGFAHDIKIVEICREFGMPCFVDDATIESMRLALQQAETMSFPSDQVTRLQMYAGINQKLLRDHMALSR